MDQKRLVLAIAVSLAILLGFQYLIAPHLPKPPPSPEATTAPATMSPETATSSSASSGAASSGTASSGSTAVGARPEQEASQVPKTVPRVAIEAEKLTGSISLLGARLDDIALNDYRDTVDPNSPHVRLLEPRSEPTPYYVQYGWTAPAGETVALPGDDYGPRPGGR